MSFTYALSFKTKTIQESTKEGGGGRLFVLLIFGKCIECPLGVDEFMKILLCLLSSAVIRHFSTRAF